MPAVTVGAGAVLLADAVPVSVTDSDGSEDILWSSEAVIVIVFC